MKRKSILAVLLLALACSLCACKSSDKDDAATASNLNTAYLAASSDTVPLYQMQEMPETGENAGEDILAAVTSVPRGSAVTYDDNDTLTWYETDYILVNYNDSSYYVPSGCLTEDANAVVLETIKYVRTSVTVYANSEDAQIASWLRKGTELSITGFDYVKDDGSVNMYQITSGDTSGWVYGKYLVNDPDSAAALSEYNDLHVGRSYSVELYGGNAWELDYYPVEKPAFEDNPLQTEARCLYVNGTGVANIDEYIQLALSSGINSIVVDIKDGSLAYNSDVAAELCPTANSYVLNETSDYQAAIQAIKDAGLYAIGRIVVFNDSDFAADHPDCTIVSDSSQAWPSAFSREAWYYNVSLAVEAVRTMGFNEIQFDYVRFPEDAYHMSDTGADFHNTYDEEKSEALQNFLYYATDVIHREGAYLSVDVFGECSNPYMTAYGQYYPAISNIVDAISSMPYSDHWGRENDTWTEPYDTLYAWAVRTATRRTECPTPAVDRTWITAYNTPFWDPTVDYDADVIASEIQALYDGGLTGGFITWNSASSLDKYNEIADAFGRTYSQSSQSSEASSEETELETE